MRPILRNDDRETVEPQNDFYVTTRAVCRRTDPLTSGLRRRKHSASPAGAANISTWPCRKNAAHVAGARPVSDACSSLSVCCGSSSPYTPLCIHPAGRRRACARSALVRGRYWTTSVVKHEGGHESQLGYAVRTVHRRRESRCGDSRAPATHSSVAPPSFEARRRRRASGTVALSHAVPAAACSSRKAAVGTTSSTQPGVARAARITPSGVVRHAPVRV